MISKRARETFIPIGNIVLVRKFDAAKLSMGGIELPEKARKEQPRGIVVAVGEGTMLPHGQRQELMVKPGDVVMIGGAGYDVELDGDKNLFAIEYGQIVGIVRPKD